MRDAQMVCVFLESGKSNLYGGFAVEDLFIFCVRFGLGGAHGRRGLARGKMAQSTSNCNRERLNVRIRFLPELPNRNIARANVIMHKNVYATTQNPIVPSIHSTQRLSEGQSSVTTDQRSTVIYASYFRVSSRTVQMSRDESMY